MKQTRWIPLLSIPALLLSACQVPEVASSTAAPSPPLRVSFERVGTVHTPDGEIDRAAYSKLAPWPSPDGYAYSGCYPHAPLVANREGSDRCFMTIDVRDPNAPVRVALVNGYDVENSPSPPVGHAVWSATYPFPNLPARSPCRVNWSDPDIAAGRTAPPCWDPGWNTQTHYMGLEKSVLAINQERFRTGTNRQANYRGVRFFDVSDPTRPTLLSYWEAPASAPDAKTGATADSQGVHHFNFHGDYLLLGTEYAGFVGRILVILDVRDPKQPREIAKWWLPGQKTPEEDHLRDWVMPPIFSSPIVRRPDGKWNRYVGMHYVTPDGDRAYLSYHQAGLVTLDISDIAKPKLLSHVDYLSPGKDPTNPNLAACRAAAGTTEASCGNSHSAKRVPGRDLLVMSDEYFSCPYGHVRLFDISDPAQPKLLSHYAPPETLNCDPTQPRRTAEPARFPQRGPSSHIGNTLDPDLYFMAWYGLGLKVIDLSDPTRPVEAGSYSYEIDDELGENDPKFSGLDAYDVLIGPDRHVYLADGVSGFRVLRYTRSGGVSR